MRDFYQLLFAIGLEVSFQHSAGHGRFSQGPKARMFWLAQRGVPFVIRATRG